jgi:hypothetical protein
MAGDGSEKPYVIWPVGERDLWGRRREKVYDLVHGSSSIVNAMVLFLHTEQEFLGRTGTDIKRDNYYWSN